MHVVLRLVLIEERCGALLDWVEAAVVLLGALVQRDFSCISNAVLHVRVHGVELDIVCVHFGLGCVFIDVYVFFCALCAL